MLDYVPISVLSGHGVVWGVYKVSMRAETSWQVIQAGASHHGGLEGPG